MPQVRTRFAPSPTGYLHIGGARTALFSWLYARSLGGVFVLRIEDTDMARGSQESVDMLIRDLKWLGLDWDEGPAEDGHSSRGPEGPYFQSQRLEIYAGYLEQLKAKGLAYPSFESKEEVEAERALAIQEGRTPVFSGQEATPEELREKLAQGLKPAWRFRVPEEGVTEFEDLVHGRTRFENRLMGDFVIVRSDGVPTYNFAAAVDDSLMRISHVIRGDDHLSNTPRQVCLYQALGLPQPAFAHIPMILGPDKQRLSKRHGATAVGEYLTQGFLPEALVNYLALLGWSLDGKTTLFSLKELVSKFTLERVGKHAAVFDTVKLEWMNGQYMRKADLDRLAELALPHFIRAGYTMTDQAWFKRLIQSVQDKARTLASLPADCAFFFEDAVTPTPEALEKFFENGEPLWLKKLDAQLATEAGFNAASLEPLVRGFGEAEGLTFKAIVGVLRAALSGRTVSPGLFETMALLGKDKCLARIRASSAWKKP